MAHRNRFVVWAVAVALWSSTAASAAEVQVYTDREIRPVLLEALNRAERTIDVEMYVLSDAEVVEALAGC